MADKIDEADKVDMIDMAALIDMACMNCKACQKILVAVFLWSIVFDLKKTDC